MIKVKSQHCSALVRGALLCTLLARVETAAADFTTASSNLSFSLSLAVMSEASKVAQALNLWAREGLDMMGGADGKALDELLNEFLVEPGSETHPQDCKSISCVTIHYC